MFRPDPERGTFSLGPSAALGAEFFCGLVCQDPHATARHHKFSKTRVHQLPKATHIWVVGSRHGIVSEIEAAAELGKQAVRILAGFIFLLELDFFERER
jgi:hypothetical protein